MGIRGCSEHAEDFRSPVLLLVAVPGAAARPHAATHHPLARSQRCSQAVWALRLLRGRDPAPGLGRGTPARWAPAHPGRCPLAGLGTRRKAARDPQSPRRARQRLWRQQRSGHRVPRLLHDVQPARDFSPPTSFHRAR